jgi:hypothetical protein
MKREGKGTPAAWIASVEVGHTSAVEMFVCLLGIAVAIAVLLASASSFAIGSNGDEPTALVKNAVKQVLDLLKDRQMPPGPPQAEADPNRRGPL